jgi:hypothetical protein
VRLEVFTAVRMAILFFRVSTLCRRVDSQRDDNVSEKYTVSIFRDEDDGDSVFLRNVGIYLRVYTSTKRKNLKKNIIINRIPKYMNVAPKVRYAKP